MVTMVHWFRLRTLLLILTPFCYANLCAQPDPHILDLRKLWIEGRYHEVLPQLLQYRDEPYGKNPEIDYMIATSACKDPNLRNLGFKYFQWLLSSYSLGAAYDAISKQMDSCGSSSKILILNFAPLRSSAGVRGKTYYLLEGKDKALITAPVKVKRELSFSELQARLVTPEFADRRINFAKRTFGTVITAKSSGRFLLISLSRHSEDTLTAMATSLNRILDYYVNQFDVPVPNYLITVYLTPDFRTLSQLADTVHGLDLPSSSIGYSFANDLSIAGIIQRSHKYVGTLAHELFHLVVRSDFGDIPPWLDEGVAALFEEHGFRGDSLIGRPNWRGRILEAFWNERPLLMNLIQMDWRSFDNLKGDHDAIQQAANHATARYFALYLQNHGALREVLAAFRKRNVENLRNDLGSESVNLLEGILKSPLSDVDKSFETWFKTLDH